QLGHTRPQTEGTDPRLRRRHGYVLPQPGGVSAGGVLHPRPPPGPGGIRVRSSLEAARLAAVDQRGADADHGPAHRTTPAAPLSAPGPAPSVTILSPSGHSSSSPRRPP